MAAFVARVFNPCERRPIVVPLCRCTAPPGPFSRRRPAAVRVSWNPAGELASMNRFSDDDQEAAFEAGATAGGTPAAPTMPQQPAPEAHRPPGVHPLRRRHAHEPVVPAYHPSAG